MRCGPVLIVDHKLPGKFIRKSELNVTDMNLLQIYCLFSFDPTNRVIHVSIKQQKGEGEIAEASFIA